MPNLLNIVVVGAGGTASYLMPALATYIHNFTANTNDLYNIYLIDGDSVEPKNLARQAFDRKYVTANKAEALALPLKEQGYNIQAIPTYLGENNIGAIKERDIVIICADNFTVRKRIEDHVLTLNDATVINAGNELDHGSCQIWIRKDGKNESPRLSFMHPEVAVLTTGTDRAEMSCAEVAQLPGGEQTLLANFTSAAHIMFLLTNFLTSGKSVPTEIQWDLTPDEPMVNYVDMRWNPKWEA